MHELWKAARPIIAIATGGIALWITKMRSRIFTLTEKLHVLFLR
jgi:hypothetical protein